MIKLRKAKQKQIVLNARAVYTAAQADLDELYVANQSANVNKTTDINTTADVSSKWVTGDGYTIYVKEPPLATGTDHHASYTISAMTYKESGKEIYFIDGGSWDTTQPADWGTYAVTSVQTYTK